MYDVAQYFARDVIYCRLSLDMWHSTCACLYVVSNVVHMTGP